MYTPNKEKKKKNIQASSSSSSSILVHLEETAKQFKRY